MTGPHPLRIGLLGGSLGHSLSPVLFADLLAQRAAPPYGLFPTPEGALPEFISRAWQEGLAGFNVTMPHKVAVRTFLEGETPEAAAVGAVNCVVRTRTGWFGHNTDLAALAASLRPWYSGNGPALVLGAGGAARAAVAALGRLGIGPLSVAARNPGRFADHGLPGVSVAVPWRAREDAAQEASLIINATPVGMTPDDGTAPLLADFAHQPHVYDLIYRPRPTLLLRRAAQCGCATRDGLEMLSRQAALSWTLWTGEPCAWQPLHEKADKFLAG